MGRVDELIQQLETGDAKQRRKAARALGDYRDPRAIDALIRIVEDQSVDGDVRAEVARALGRIGNPKAIEPLIRALHKNWNWNESGLRPVIAETLGAFRDPRVTDALLRALSYGVDVGRACVESLKKLRDRRAVEPLIRILNKDEPGHGFFERRLAAEILGALGDPRAIPALFRALREDKCEPDIDQVREHCRKLRKAARESLLAFVPTHPDAILRTEPEDRNLLARQFQEMERNRLWMKLCNYPPLEEWEP
jgi:HEAT repeat protein